MAHHGDVYAFMRFLKKYWPNPGTGKSDYSRPANEFSCSFKKKATRRDPGPSPRPRRLPDRAPAGDEVWSQVPRTNAIEKLLQHMATGRASTHKADLIIDIRLKSKSLSLSAWQI